MCGQSSPIEPRRLLPFAQPASPWPRHALPPSAILPTGRLAGRLRYDALVDGRTRIMPTWLLTTADRQVAARLITLLGGQPYAGNGDGEEPTYHVQTDHAEIDIFLDGPQAITLRMLRRHGATVFSCCDGRIQQTAQGKRPCHCPPTFKRRWQYAKAGRGCEPLVHIAFRLAADPTLGRFLLSIGTWTFADHALTVKPALRRHSRPVRARLAIDRTLHSTVSGSTFAYSSPTITILNAKAGA
jgi:hypothetical protein